MQMRLRPLTWFVLVFSALVFALYLDHVTTLRRIEDLVVASYSQRQSPPETSPLWKALEEGHRRLTAEFGEPTSFTFRHAGLSLAKNVWTAEMQVKRRGVTKVEVVHWAGGLIMTRMVR